MPCHRCGGLTEEREVRDEMIELLYRCCLLCGSYLLLSERSLVIIDENRKALPDPTLTGHAGRPKKRSPGPLTIPGYTDLTAKARKRVLDGILHQDSQPA